jgi:hypothetical protein
MQVQMQQTKTHFLQSQTRNERNLRRSLSLREEKGLKNEINVRRLKPTTSQVPESLVNTGDKPD